LLRIAEPDGSDSVAARAVDRVAARVDGVATGRARPRPSPGRDEVLRREVTPPLLRQEG
jgi:hypothetical protein